MQALVDKFTPVFYLHSDEKHYPSSIDFILKNTNLEHNKQIIDTNITTKKLWDFTQKNYPGQTGLENLYLLFKNPTQDLLGQKDLVNVPIYAVVKSKNDRWIIYYFMLFPFNLGKNVLLVQQAGDHEGDLEHLTVEVDKTTNQVIRVHYGAHGTADGRWVEARDLPMVDGKIVAYIGKGGHGLYPAPGVAYRIFGLANDVMNTAVKWSPKVIYIPLVDQPGWNPDRDGWIYFAGRLGFDGIPLLSDKGWFKYGDKEDNELEPPPIFDEKYLFWYRLSKYSTLFGVLLFIIGFGLYQNKVSKKVFFGIYLVIIAVLVKVLQDIIQKVA